MSVCSSVRNCVSESACVKMYVRLFVSMSVCTCMSVSEYWCVCVCEIVFVYICPFVSKRLGM